jgi:hypothetical protein
VALDLAALEPLALTATRPPPSDIGVWAAVVTESLLISDRGVRLVEARLTPQPSQEEE